MNAGSLVKKSWLYVGLVGVAMLMTSCFFPGLEWLEDYRKARQEICDDPELALPVALLDFCDQNGRWPDSFGDLKQWHASLYRGVLHVEWDCYEDVAFDPMPEGELWVSYRIRHAGQGADAGRTTQNTIVLRNCQLVREELRAPRQQHRGQDPCR